jgi:vancomycin resistance protein YoaR
MGENVGSKTKEELNHYLKERIETLKNEKVKFKNNDQVVEFQLSDFGIKIDQEKSLKPIWQRGHNQNIFLNFFDFLENLFFSKNYSLSFNTDEEIFYQLIEDEFEQTKDSPVSAKVVFSKNKFSYTKAKTGMGVDTLNLILDLNDFINSPHKNQIYEIKKIKKDPQIKDQEAKKAASKANQIINNDDLKIKALEKTWQLDKAILSDFISFEKANGLKLKERFNPLNQDQILLNYYSNVTGLEPDLDLSQKLKVVLDEKKLKDYLLKIAPSVEQSPKNATLSFQNNQIQILEKSRKEIELDITQSIAVLKKEIPQKKELIELPVLEKSAPVSKETLDELGLKTLIAEGNSDFKGSPKNRRHNISLGASKFDGILVAPGETFSFLEHLGPVDASTGYLPELVIKSNRTEPEYGGGMCQVSTTSFRGAVKAGLEIVERRNHAYPVHYYAPQGTDATVYIPSPDLKFKNNTPSHVYIQTKIEGDTLTFEYYGTDDGRKVETEDPVIYGRTGDGGMRARWVQKVYYPDGTLWFEDEFLSKYNSPNKYPHPGEEPPKEDD